MKFLAVFLTASLLTAAITSISSKAAKRGSRIVASAAAHALRITLVEHPAEDGNLSLVIEGADGANVRNDGLVAALDQDEDDVRTYHVSAKIAREGGFVISSVKDWGASNWRYGYTVALENGAYRPQRFDYRIASRRRHVRCSLDLATGASMVNGRSVTFEAPASEIEQG